MAAIVKSIEKFTITLAAGTTKASATLTKGQVKANCVPVIGTRITTPNGADFHGYAPDAYFEIGTEEVSVETGAAATRALVVEVTVHEFDPSVSNTSVLQETFAFTTSEDSSDVQVDLTKGATLDEHDVTKAFPYVTWQMGGATSAWGACCCFAEFKPTDASIMEMDRWITGSVTMTGHLYVVQSDEFTVQWEGFNATGATGSATWDTAITLAETFVMGSYKNANGGLANAPSTLEVSTTDTTLAIQAANGADARQGTWYAVSMDSSVGNVQHGSLTESASPTVPTTVEITAVDEGRSVVMATGLPGNMGGGSFPGTASADVQDAFCAWDFVDTDTIQVTHSTGGGEASNDLTWQVIEWELTAGAPATPRRVMVVS